MKRYPSILMAKTVILPFGRYVEVAVSATSDQREWIRKNIVRLFCESSNVPGQSRTAHIDSISQLRTSLLRTTSEDSRFFGYIVESSCEITVKIDDDMDSLSNQEVLEEICRRIWNVICDGASGDMPPTWEDSYRDGSGKYMKAEWNYSEFSEDICQRADEEGGEDA